MKAKEITMQIVKNLGNYETVRLEITAELMPEEDLLNCFQVCKAQLEKSFEELYKKQPKTRELLTMTHPKLQCVISALINGKADIKLVQESFIIDKEVFNLLNREGIL